jgi:hypothetical protein
MTDKELINFFEEYSYLPVFLRTKTIFELTNGLDVFLLKTLKNDFSTHYLKKAYDYCRELEGLKKVELPADFGHIHHNAQIMMKKYLHQGKQNIFSATMDFYLGETEYEMIKIIFEEEADFLYEIDELISYKEKVFKAIEESPNSEEETELINLDDETLVSKIIFLYQTGVIDELRKQVPFNTSINSLATLLSAITGGKSASIQPMLNAMLSTNVSEKNNPLNSLKTVNIVKKKLANIGYDSRKR